MVGRTSSFLATALIPTALTLVVIQATGSASDLGLVLAAELVPQLLLLPVGGAIADRFSAQRVALGADLVRGIAQLVIGVELILGSVRVVDLALLSAVTGAAIAFSIPTMSPLVNATVPAASRLRANSHLGVVRGVAFVAGPGIAGTFVITVGGGWSFVVTALLCVIAAVALGGIRAPAREQAPEDTSFFRDLADGWSEVRSRPWFWSNLLGHGAANLAAGVLMTLGPLIAVRDLGGEGSWVVIYQVGMAGMIGGALVAPRLPVRRPLVATSVCGALLALPLITFVAPAPTWVNAAAYGIAMLGIGALNTLWMTALQLNFPPHTLARADSYDQLLSLSARPLGLAVAAPMATLAGTATPLLASAALVVIVNLAIIALPDVRSMRIERSQDQQSAPSPA
ncbi:MFS transporter [Actinomadura sp. 6K520]|nr:MFS transporter [Actinomadura sp. 6K520]